MGAGRTPAIQAATQDATYEVASSKTNRWRNVKRTFLIKLFWLWVWRKICNEMVSKKRKLQLATQAVELTAIKTASFMIPFVTNVPSLYEKVVYFRCLTYFLHVYDQRGSVTLRKYSHFDISSCRAKPYAVLFYNTIQTAILAIDQ